MPWCIVRGRGVTSFARSDGGGQNLNQGGKGFRRNGKDFSVEITNFPTKAGDLQNKGLRRNPKAFSGRNRKLSDQKQVISKKKKISAQKHQLLHPRKIPWGRQEKNRGDKNENRGHCSPTPPLATRLVRGLFQANLLLQIKNENRDHILLRKETRLLKRTFPANNAPIKVFKPN